MSGEHAPWRPTRRALARGAWLTGASTALAACVPGGRASEAPAAAQGPVTAKILTFNNVIFQTPKDALLAVLPEVDPTLKPDIIVFPGQIGQFRTAALTMYAGGDIPDAQWMHPSITTLMAGRKLVRPIEELAKRDKENLKDFYANALEQYAWKGSTYALPWYTTGAAWFFNRQLFERMGVPAPDVQDREGKWNWDGFLSSMRGVTRGLPGDPDRTIGTAAHNANLDWLCAWIWRNGGDVFSKDLKQCVLNQPAAAEAIQGFADLHLKHQVVVYGPHMNDFQGGFQTGRIGLRYAAKSDTSPEEAPFRGIAFPVGTVGTYKGKAGRVNRQAPIAFAAANNAPNGDAGWRWMRFMTSAKAQAVLIARGGTLPIKPGHQQLPEFAKSMQPFENKDVWLESQATARVLQQPTNYDDIATLWNATWTAILGEKGPTKSLLDDFVRQVNSLLAVAD